MTTNGRQSDNRKAIIIGAGIGGLATAISLRSIGLDVQVYERAHELKEVGAGLSLWRNAIRACEQLGLREAVLQAGVPVQRMQSRSQDGNILQSVVAKEFSLGTDIPVSLGLLRPDLQRILLDAVGNGVIHLDHDCIEVDDRQGSITARFANGNEANGDLLIGADGIHSTIRTILHGQEQPRYTGISVWRGLVQFDHPIFRAATTFQSLGQGKRFLALPVRDNRVYWGGTIRIEEKVFETATQRKQAALDAYKGWHEPIPDLITATDPQAIKWDGAYDRPRLDQWGRNAVTLLGDAAHLTAPFLGQGACQALEDAVWLARYLDDSRDTPSALRKFESHRQKRTSMITRSSRLAGRMFHINNPVMASVRNSLVKFMPPAITMKPMLQAITDDL